MVSAHDMTFPEICSRTVQPIRPSPSFVLSPLFPYHYNPVDFLGGFPHFCCPSNYFVSYPAKLFDSAHLLYKAAVYICLRVCLYPSFYPRWTATTFSTRMWIDLGIVRTSTNLNFSELKIQSKVREMSLTAEKINTFFNLHPIGGGGTWEGGVGAWNACIIRYPSEAW